MPCLLHCLQTQLNNCCFLNLCLVRQTVLVLETCHQMAADFLVTLVSTCSLNPVSILFQILFSFVLGQLVVSEQAVRRLITLYYLIVIYEQCQRLLDFFRSLYCLLLIIANHFHACGQLLALMQNIDFSPNFLYPEYSLTGSQVGFQFISCLL